jgi:hypothetical protein
MIQHIFEKDCRLLWPYVGALIIIRMTIMGLLELMSRGPNEFSARLVDLAWLVLPMMVLQEEALEGMNQDWLVRPIPRRDLLAAKFLFITSMVLLPSFLVGIVNAEGVAHSLRGATEFAAWELLVRVAILLPCLAIASIFGSLRVAVGVSMVVFLACFLSAYTNTPLTFSFGWLVKSVASGLMLASAAIVLLLTYLWRKRTAAIVLLAAAVLCVVIVGRVVPYAAWFELLSRFSAERGTSRNIVVTAPVHGTTPLTLQVTGLPPNTRVFNDASRIRLANGEVVTFDPGAEWIAARNFLRAPWEDRITLRIPPVSGPATAELFLTLMRVSAQYVIPVSDGRLADQPCRGHAYRRDDQTFEVSLTCDFPERPACYSAALERMPGGEPLSTGSSCRPNYQPFGTPAILFPKSFPLASLVGAGSRDDSKDLRVVLKIYEPLEHFTRQVNLPVMSGGL